MNQVAGIITLPKKKHFTLLPVQPLNALDIELGGGEWDLGIDQSTSCTGICLERTDGAIQCLLDIHRDRALEDRVFYRDLFRTLQKLAHGNKFRYIIMEKPAPKAMLASRVLMELKGRMEEWIDMIPEFEGATVDSLFQQTWKSFVVNKAKGKGRSKSKFATSTDLCDHFPMLLNYLDLYPFSDYDSFDAAGILFGYKKYALSENGLDMIHGTIEKTHVSIAGYRWINNDDLADAVKCLGDFVYVKTPKVLVYNSRYNLHENIRMASSTNDFVICTLPSNVLESLMWEYDIDIDDKTHTMVLYVLRKGSFTKRQLEWFKEIVPWSKEVYNS